MAEINPSDYILIGDKDSKLYLAKERSLFNLDADSQIRRLQGRNGFAPTIRDFVDFVLLLDSRRRVYDGRGKLVSTVERRRLLDEAIGKRNPWRAEYLDNRFFEYKGDFYMASRHRVVIGHVTPLSVKEIRPLLQDGNINLKNLDDDGLATKVGEIGNMFYICPRSGAVAEFEADVGSAYLYCGRISADSGSWLGVREARESFDI